MTSTLLASEHGPAPAGQAGPGAQHRRMPHWPVAMGLVGTTAIAVAGSGLARIHGSTVPLPWFFALPGSWSSSHHFLLIGCYYAGLGLLSAAWLILGRSLRPGYRPDIHALWGAAAIWAVPLVVGPALNSSDMYVYLGQAAVAHAGLDPYRFGPAVLGHSRLLSSIYAPWRTAQSPYGPLFLALGGIVGALAGSHISLGVLGMRLLAVGGLMVVARYLPRLATALGADPVRATWLGVASPLMLLEFVMGGHNDIIMIALLVVALTLREEGRPVVAIGLCALAVMVKVPAVLALGFVTLAWASTARSRRAQLSRVGWAGLVSAGVMAVTSLVAGLGWGWLSSDPFSTTHHVLFTKTPMDVIALLTGAMLRAFGSRVAMLGAVGGVHIAALVLAGAFCLGVLWRVRLLGWTRSIGLCLLVVAILAPTSWPWYLAWGLVMLAATVPAQRAGAMVTLAAGAEFAFGPPVISGVLVILVLVCVATPYWLAWSYRHLVRPALPGGRDRGVVGRPRPVLASMKEAR